MILTVNAEDITRLTVGLVDDNHQIVAQAETVPCSPEDYLAIIDTYLRAHDCPLAALTAIQLSSGEGSATSLRTAHAIVNALGFALGIPLKRTLTSPPVSILLPEYANEVRITARKKDTLNRKS